MQKLRTLIRGVLMICGALSIVGVVVLAGVFVYQMRNFAKLEPSKTDKASTQDVRFVLNDCKLGEARAEAVLHSYVSSRSFTGDHVDAYVIKVGGLTVADLKPPASDADGGWLRGDQLPPVFAEAVRMSSGFISSEKLTWFPEESALLSAQYYVWISGIYLHGRQATEAYLIFANPKTGTVYYSSVKW